MTVSDLEFTFASPVLETFRQESRESSQCQSILLSDVKDKRDYSQTSDNNIDNANLSMKEDIINIDGNQHNSETFNETFSNKQPTVKQLIAQFQDGAACNISTSKFSEAKEEEILDDLECEEDRDTFDACDHRKHRKESKKARKARKARNRKEELRVQREEEAQKQEEEAQRRKDEARKRLEEFRKWEEFKLRLGALPGT